MRDATSACCATTPREALHTRPSEGYGPLRDWVAAEMARQGLRVSPAQVLITTGSQQGLDLVGKVLIDAGSRVAVESPTYLGALQAFVAVRAGVRQASTRRRRRAAARRAPVERRRRALPLPAAQFPEPERSLDLGEAAAPSSPGCRGEAGLPIVEDNPYGDLWFDARRRRRSLRAGAEARSTSARSRRCSRPVFASAT